jgi:hypothetical protein
LQFAQDLTVYVIKFRNGHFAPFAVASLRERKRLRNIISRLSNLFSQPTQGWRVPAPCPAMHLVTRRSAAHIAGIGYGRAGLGAI